MSGSVATPDGVITLILLAFVTLFATEVVRARYQNRTLTLPLCQKVGDHLEGRPEFCTLEAFSRRVKELTPDWEAECAIPSHRR